MATRSGKPYHHGNKRKRSTLKDTTIDNNNTLTGDDIEDNLNISSMSTRELRTRKNIKDFTFDKGETPAAKLVPGHATESNWIISSVVKKGKRKGVKENVDKEPENDVNASSIVTKPLRRRRSNVADTTVERIDQNNTTYEKEKEVVKSKKGKENVRKDDTFNKSILSENDDNADQKVLEVDTNTDNVASKQSKKKKKKVKGNKKKQKIKTTEDSLESTNKVVETIEKDSKIVTLDKHFDNNKITEKVIVNSPKVSKKLLRSKKTNVKDVPEITNKIVEKELESDDTSSVNSKEIKSDPNVTFDKNNDTFDKDVSTTSTSFDTFKKGAITRKSSIRDKSNTSILNLTREDLENDNNIISSSASKRKSLKRQTLDIDNSAVKTLNSTFDKLSNKNSSVHENIETNNIMLLSPATKRKSLRRQTLDLNNSLTQSLDSTFDKTSNSKQSLAKEDLMTDKVSLLSPTAKRKSLRPQTIEINDSDINNLNSTFDKTTKMKQNLVENDLKLDKVSLSPSSKRKSLRRQTIDISDTAAIKLNSTFDKTANNRQSLVKEDFNTNKVTLFSPVSKRKSLRSQTIEINDSDQKLDSTYDKTNSKQSLGKEDLDTDSISISSPRKSLRRLTADLNNSVTKRLDSTYEKISKNETDLKHKSQQLSEAIVQKLNTTFEKEAEQVSKCSLLSSDKSSLISSDNSVSDKEISRISITSDDTVEDIGDTTPVLIESSMETSLVKDSPKPQTPLKREGTFTKDGPEVQPQSPRTPGKRGSSIMPPAGCTPYHISKSSNKKPPLNVTRSIEKRKSVDPAPRLTRVMFCSPVDNPALVAQERKKVIKSNLKGSNKSFVYEETVSVSRVGRKRSYTQNDADISRAKRSRLTEDLQQSVNRLSRPRTASAAGKLTETTPKKGLTPFRSKSESKPLRTRLPNFAAMHQKQFDKMESLDECQERKAKRARQMLTPTGPTNVLDRISPKSDFEAPKPATKDTPKPKDKTETPSKKTYTLESLRPGFTRFGFKLNLDVPNPFSIPPKTDKVKEKPNGLVPKPVALPSLTGATSLRREAAKQTVMREKSFLERKRNLNRNENRTIIKGVRTNRRFELQMKLRNIE